MFIEKSREQAFVYYCACGSGLLHYRKRSVLLRVEKGLATCSVRRCCV